MRRLNVKQKNALRIAFENRHIVDIADLYFRDEDEIYEMNPHETFEANANRYINDLWVAKEIP